MFWVSLVLTVLTACLSLKFVRDFFRRWRFLTWLTDDRSDRVRFTLFFTLATISAILYNQSQASKRALEESLRQAENTIAENKKREELARYAMINFFGEDTRDISGVADGRMPMRATLKRADVFKRVFIVEEKEIIFGGHHCKEEQYLKDINTLVEFYPLIPYGHVALAQCLKLNGDSSWRSVAEHAKILTEDMLHIHPHAATYDSVYGMLMVYILGIGIPKDSPYYEWRENNKGGYYQILVNTEQ
jgi:hypothetical protein